MPDKPNILIVMTDHQRGDTVLPEHPAITPNVSKLARQGVSFTQAFCPSPHCCPSRATFHSGLYPSLHGVWNNVCNMHYIYRGLREGVRLWSEDLAGADYQMLFTGKWHVSSLERPQDRGWDVPGGHFTCFELCAEDWKGYRRLAGQHHSTERKAGQILRPGYGTYTLYGETYDQENAHQNDLKSVEVACQELGRLDKSSQPWTMFVGLQGPHDPYCVPGKYLDMYRLDDIPLPPNYEDSLEDKPRIYQRLRRTRFGQLTDREVRDGIRHFWAYCTYLDDMFGQILDALERTGSADNTLVVFCSDHGDYCGEHGLFVKGIPCFRGAYHVPAVVRWPAGIPRPGRRIDEFVSLADFAPTFLELAGIKTDRHFTGQSLVPFLEDRTPAGWRDDIHTQCNGVELYYTQRSVTTKQHKYVFNGFDDDELYDLQNDPHEMHNLVDRVDMEPVKRQLCRRMWRFAHDEGDMLLNGYITVGLVPFGPAELFSAD